MADFPHALESRASDALGPEALLAEIQQVMAAIRQGHASLAQQPDDGGQCESDLLALIDRRQELARSLGPSLVRWLASGGQVVLTAATSAATTDTKPQDPEPVHTPNHDQEAEAAPPPSDPAPVSEAAPVSDAAPVSEAALHALAQGGLTPNWSSDHTLAQRQRALRRILREIGRPTRPRTLNQQHLAVEALAAVVAGMDAWLAHPQGIQRALMGLASSMARHLQDEQKQPLDASDSTTMSTMFSRMTRWSGQHRPGFVSGLSRSNTPATESWLADARDWWERLQHDAHPDGEAPESPEATLRDLAERIEEEKPERKALLALVRSAVQAGISQSDPRLLTLLLPHTDAFKGAKGLKTLKTQLRQAQRPEEAALGDDRADDERMPPTWPLYPRTRDKVAVIVGGDDRSHAADRIKTAFAFREVRWESGSPRRSAALADRVRAGRSVDMVILLRSFISHKSPDVLVPACKESGVDLVVVDHGYGVTQVRLAMERFLADESR